MDKTPPPGCNSILNEWDGAPKWNVFLYSFEESLYLRLNIIMLGCAEVEVTQGSGGYWMSSQVWISTHDATSLMSHRGCGSIAMDGQ